MRDKMNQKLFDRIIKDSEFAVSTVRQIKDADVEKFHAGETTKFVTWNWFVDIVEDLCMDIEG